MKIFRDGLIMGLILQLAIGPIFFFIANLALRGNILYGLAGVLAVTIVDYFYITLSIFGVGKLLENEKAKKAFGIASSVLLVVFGLIVIKGSLGGMPSRLDGESMTLLSSFVSVFLLTISSPMTIIFFTGIFTVKALECNYTRKQLFIYGFGTGLATFLFMTIAVIIFSMIRGSIPEQMIRLMHIIVGCVLFGYGGIRFSQMLGK